jgi:hypothetical protein
VTREDDAGAEGVVQLGGPEAAGVERARDELVEGPEGGELGPVAGDPDADSADVGAHRPRRSWAWAALMHRAFALEVLACPGCGGRLRVIATVQDPSVVRAILAHLGAAAPDRPGPA